MELYKKLTGLGLCQRCAYRYIGIRDPAAYELNSKLEVIKNIKGEVITNSCDEPSAKIKKSNTCITCLGLLEDLVKDEAVQEICQQVKDKGYDSPLIACAVSLPIAMQIRAHSLLLHLEEEEDKRFSSRHIVPIKEAWKWTCSKRIAEAIGKEASSGAACDFLVNIPVLYNDDKTECKFLQEIHGEKFDERRRNHRKFRGEMYTRQSVEALLDKTSMEKFKKVYSIPPETPTEPVQYGQVSCSQSAIFIAGRYNKFSRELCQTPWVVEGERRIDGSVQEFICKPIEELVKSASNKFLSSGREDVDVRTLGRGRPFAVELADPHKTIFTAEDFKTIQNTINNNCKQLIAVRDLQVVGKDELQILKTGEETKCKDYEALCISLDKPLDPLKLEALSLIKDLVLSQKTPVRVLHRRPLATRSRTIYNMSARMLDDKQFILNVRTQAGTYVKEFVHGDFGRTSPDLGSLLGTSVDILALDVQNVDLDWPKQILD